MEQLYRDNRLNPIHEGTTGIQAIDLIGRKTWADQGRGFGLLAERISGTIAECRGGGRLAEEAEALELALATVGSFVERIVMSLDLEERSASAALFLSAVGHLTVGWIWLDQAKEVLRQDLTDSYSGKLWACRHFVAYELPRVAQWLGTAEKTAGLWQGAPTRFSAPR